MSTTKVTDSVRDTTAVDAAKITTGTIPEARITTLDATKLTGNIADARVPASAVTQHVTPTDLTAVRQDIAMLALYNAVSDNRAAYNLPNSFIDQFEDDTGLTTQTNVDRDATGEYVASVYSSVTPHTAFDYAGSSETYTWHGTTASQINLANIYNLNPTDVTAYWASPSTGYATGLTVDYLTTLSNISKIGVSKANYYGCARQFRIRYSLDNSNWTVLNLTGATTSQLGNQPDTITFVDRANGVADFNQTGAGVVHGGGLLTGWTPFDARYLRFELGTWQTLANSSTGFSSFIPYYEVGSAVANATGTLISDTQTASSATTKMSGVILYKDNAGTTTLGTDLVISLSADGGTNWTEAASYGTVTPLFSTGVKMIRLGETTVTSGTAPVIKAEWANQAASSSAAYVTGDRSSTITVTTNMTLGAGTVPTLVEGTFSTLAANAFYWNNHTPASGAYIQFAFSTATICSEAYWYQDVVAVTHGTWQWQGSNTAGGASGYSNIGSTFTLGGGGTLGVPHTGWARTQLTQLNSNTTAYLYYRLAWQSGAVSIGSWNGEVEFKQGADVTGKETQLHGWAMNY